jgi:arsenite-transporting ATPase
MRVLLMTGKGGVGKTSVAAATGLRCAELGYKTLVLSTDPAHSLADSFDQELEHDPRQVRPNLWGAELDALMELEGNWGAVKRYITEVLQARGLEGIEAEELAILPGMDEIFSLVRMKRHYDEGEFDVLIIDSAPTGTALRLLSLPEVAGWYMRACTNPSKPSPPLCAPWWSPYSAP